MEKIDKLEPKEPTLKEKLQALLKKGKSINEAAGECGLKRSDAQKVLNDRL